MKLKFNYYLSIILCLLLIGVASCKKEEIHSSDDDNNNDTIENKEFIIYDALSYKNKPDLTPYKISKLEILYEAHLTKQDPDNPSKIILDMQKINTFAELAAYKGIKIISTDIEHWYGDKLEGGSEMKENFTNMFNVFRQKISGVEISNYGIPLSALCLRRYKREHVSENEILKEWKLSNQKRIEAASAMDYFCPSVYIGVPGVDSWAKDLEITVNEIKLIDATKKIYVYLWPQYYNFSDSPYNRRFIATDDWRKMLEAVYKYCDGVILWSGTTDENGNIVNWDDPRVQKMFNATKEFINEHSANVIMKTNAPFIGPPSKEPSKFHLFHSINFKGTPDLTSYGIEKIRMATETELSEGKDANGILMPNIQKIEALALDALKNPEVPICINSINNWISDRQNSTQSMIDRFKFVYETFKTKNNITKIGYFGVGPTNISGLRLTEGTLEEQTISSWFRYAAQPMRGLRTYSDISYPTPFIIDDDLELWKNDCAKVLAEAKYNDSKQPIYAYIWTNYFNRKDTYPFFADALKPIKEATWLEMLEYLFLRCDGIVIVSNDPNNDPVTWSENLGLWKATKTFIERHKDVIVK